MPGTLGRVLREPLVHFFGLGGLLFAVHAIVGAADGPATPPAVVQVTAADADWLKQMWTRQWRRAPSDDELGGLLVDHVKEELLAREARELQLDLTDTVVRRRLAQKMTFLLEDTLRSSEPSEAELRDLYEARPDLIRAPARVSFRQVFFNREQGEERASALLATLSETSVDPQNHGDRLLLGSDFVDQDEQSVASQFGESFARAVLSAEPARWTGPLASGYGLHLVKVTAVQGSRIHDFAEVRERLAQEWHRQRQQAAAAAFYAGLMRKYRIDADPQVRALLGPFAGAEPRS
jgi:hypothetical protein